MKNKRRSETNTDGILKLAVCIGTACGIALLLCLIFIAVYPHKLYTLQQLYKTANVEGKWALQEAVWLSSEDLKSVRVCCLDEGILQSYHGVDAILSRTRQAIWRFETLALCWERGNVPLDESIKHASKISLCLLDIREAFEANPQLKTTRAYQQVVVAFSTDYDKIEEAIQNSIASAEEYNGYRMAPSTRAVLKISGDEGWLLKRIAYSKGR